jgi:hypothetical protein
MAAERSWKHFLDFFKSDITVDAQSVPRLFHELDRSIEFCASDDLLFSSRAGEI